MRQLGMRMRRRRQELGLTPRRAAEGADMSADTWKRIEAGYMDPTCGELENISNVLRTAPHILAGWHREGAGIISRLEKEDKRQVLYVEYDAPFELTEYEVCNESGYVRLVFKEGET